MTPGSTGLIDARREGEEVVMIPMVLGDNLRMEFQASVPTTSGSITSMMATS